MDLTVLVDLLKYGASPLVVIAYLMWSERKNGQKRNGPQTKDIMEKIEAAFKAHLQHADLDRTEHFDQLRRDLTTTIEKATENSMLRYMAQLEERFDARRWGKRK